MSGTVSRIGNSDVLQSAGDSDLDVINPREWRVRLIIDPVMGAFLRRVIQKSKPDMTDDTSDDDKY